jgi:hypothetical protein
MNFINIKSYLSKFQFTHYNILREIFLIHKPGCEVDFELEIKFIIL